MRAPIALTVGCDCCGATVDVPIPPGADLYLAHFWAKVEFGDGGDDTTDLEICPTCAGKVRAFLETLRVSA